MRAAHPRRAGHRADAADVRGGDGEVVRAVELCRIVLARADVALKSCARGVDRDIAAHLRACRHADDRAGDPAAAGVEDGIAAKAVHPGDIDAVRNAAAVEIQREVAGRLPRRRTGDGGILPGRDNAPCAAVDVQRDIGAQRLRQRHRAADQRRIVLDARIGQKGACDARADGEMLARCGDVGVVCRRLDRKFRKGRLRAERDRAGEHQLCPVGEAVVHAAVKRGDRELAGRCRERLCARDRETAADDHRAARRERRRRRDKVAHRRSRQRAVTLSAVLDIEDGFFSLNRGIPLVRTAAAHGDKALSGAVRALAEKRADMPAEEQHIGARTRSGLAARDGGKTAGTDGDTVRGRSRAAVQRQAAARDAVADGEGMPCRVHFAAAAEAEILDARLAAERQRARNGQHAAVTFAARDADDMQRLFGGGKRFAADREVA